MKLRPARGALQKEEERTVCPVAWMVFPFLVLAAWSFSMSACIMITRAWSYAYQSVLRALDLSCSELGVYSEQLCL